jgi:hypothetical protein
MSSTINATTVGVGGIVTTADNSGILILQTASTTALTISAAQGVTLAGTLGVTGVTTVAAGTAAAPSIVSTTGTADTGQFFPAADTIAHSTAGTERMRIDSAGNVTLQKNISVGAAAPTTSGTGITFPATQSASTNANTLDDYEEGTWTPAITGDGGGTCTMTSGASGVYTKIGNMVTVSCSSISWSAKGTLVGNVGISGLPFATAVARHVGVGGVSGSGFSFTGRLGVQSDAATTFIYLLAVANTDNTYAHFGNANVNSTGIMYGVSMTYNI